MYKLTRLKGTDFYSGTINYADNIGKIIRVKNYSGPENVCGSGIHLAKNPNDCLIGSSIPCRAFKATGIQRIAWDKHKTRYQAAKILYEIKDLDKLFKWNYTEAVNPTLPFDKTPPKITTEHIKLVKKWITLWRLAIGSRNGGPMGEVRVSIEKFAGKAAYQAVAELIWESVGWPIRRKLCKYTCIALDAFVHAYIGSIFYNVKKWKYMKHKPGVYPFQSAVDLWYAGLIVIHNGSNWEIHSIKTGDILWEIEEKY